MWTLFQAVATQWNHSMNGPTGLRYEALYPLLDRQQLEPAEWDHLFRDVQVLEAAALAAIHDTA